MRDIPFLAMFSTVGDVCDETGICAVGGVSVPVTRQPATNLPKYAVSPASRGAVQRCICFHILPLTNHVTCADKLSCC